MNEFDMTEIGKRISNFRKKTGLTQMELANKLLVSFQAVSNWERGQTMPDISNMAKLAELFSVTIDELLREPKQSEIVNAIIPDIEKPNPITDEVIEVALRILAEDNQSKLIADDIAATINRINIDIAYHSFFIQTHDSSEILIEDNIQKYGDLLDVTISSGTLKIRKRKKNNSQNTSGGGTVIIKVPANSKYDYTIEGGSGNKTLSSICATNISLTSGSGCITAETLSSEGDIRIRSGSGSTNLSSLCGNLITIGVGSGSIRAQTLNSKNAIKIRLGSGSSDLSSLCGSPITIGAGSGGVRAQTLNSKDAIKISTGSGNTDLSSLCGKLITISAGSGGIRAHELSSKDAIKISTGSGSSNLSSLCGKCIDISVGSGGIYAKTISSEGDITVNVGSGNIDFCGVNSASGMFLIDSGSGNKTLSTINAKRIDVRSGSGQMNLEQIMCTDIKMKGKSGDIAFSELNAQNIAIETTTNESPSGNVRGSIIGKQSDFSITTHTKSGKNNLPNQAGSGSKKLKVSTGIGNIDISFTEDV